jgi:hypothetical protein
MTPCDMSSFGLKRVTLVGALPGAKFVPFPGSLRPVGMG